MTVSTDIGYQRTSGDGVTTIFGVSFALIEAAQLIVELVNKTTGEISPQVLGTNFTLTIAGDNQSANVTMLVPPPATHWIIRRRSALYTQPTHLLPHGPFPADLVELAIDRMAMNIQAIRDGFLRGIRFNDTDPPNPLALPPLAQMVGRYLYIDENGNPIGVAGQGSAPVSAQWAPIVVTTSLAAGLTLLGFSTYVQSLIGSSSKAALRAALEIDAGDGAGIWGLRWAKNGANTIDVAAGGAMADDGVTWIPYVGATALDLATLFSAGGLLDGGSIADTDYFIWLMFNPTSGVARPMASTSGTTPAAQTGFTKKRLFGWIRRSGGAIVAFNCYLQAGGGVEVSWGTRTTDGTPTIGASRSLVGLARVPLGLQVMASLSVECSGNGVALDVCCPDQAAVAPANGTGLGILGGGASLTAGSQQVLSFTVKSQVRARTNTSGEVAMQASAAGTPVKFSVNSFEWSRR